MIIVPGDEPSGVVSYCIDHTEVTVKQYAEWLNEQPDPTKQPDVCKLWNTTHAPKTNANACLDYDFNSAVKTDPEHPVACVNWCDASAFCQWAGKRLCGRVGGGPSEYNNEANKLQAQWYRACSEGGNRVYPYGDMFDGSLCVGNGYSGARSVGEPGCEGGYPSLFDMSGNVGEWQDSCGDENGPDDQCRIRGGSYLSESSQLTCSYLTSTARQGAYPDLGFRCCAELQPEL